MSNIIKTLIIILLVVGIIIAGVFIYFRFYAPNETPDTPSGVPHTPAPGAPGDNSEHGHGNIPEAELIWYDGIFELPISGATGFASHNIRAYAAPDLGSEVVFDLTAGQGFTIMGEIEEWWRIMIGDEEGFVLHESCFINLPDVLPSIRYDITNAYSSLKRSSMIDIPNVTGYALYEAWSFNPRLSRHEFIVPTLYSTAKLIAEIQKSALENNDTLIIFEVYRPHVTQRRVVENLSELMRTNPTVNQGVNTPPWSISWFISTGVSNHQRGAAVDASLAFVLHREVRASGRFAYYNITDFEQRIMPTEMHELSARAASLTAPVSGREWRNANDARSMTQGAVLLRTYFTNVGFTPIASEWWHFDDRNGIAIAHRHRLQGNFFTETIYSIEPWLDFIDH